MQGTKRLRLLAPADQVQIKARRGIPRLLGKGPIRKVSLHGLTVVVIVLQELSVVVVSVYVHQSKYKFFVNFWEHLFSK